MMYRFLLGLDLALLGLLIAYWEWRDEEIIDRPGRRRRPMDRD